MEKTVILRGREVVSFCKELGIDKAPNIILININNDKAEYYNGETDTFYKLDIEIAKKYM